MNFIEEEDNRFFIKESTIPNAGLGCFAKEDLKKGDWLEVIGAYVKKGSAADVCTSYAKRYKFAGSPTLDAKIVPFGYAGMVNHSDDPTLRNCELIFDKKRLKRSQHAGQVFYLFIKDIAAGEELIGNYGPDVGSEIDKISQYANYVTSQKDEIEEFLSYNLYSLKNLFHL